MGKSTHFFGQPVYGQLIKSLDREKIILLSGKRSQDHDIVVLSIYSATLWQMKPVRLYQAKRSYIPSRLQLYHLLPYWLSNKSTVTHPKFYRTVIINNTGSTASIPSFVSRMQ